MRGLREILCLFAVLTSCRSQWLVLSPMEDAMEPEVDPWVGLVDSDMPHTLVLSDPLDYGEPEVEEPVTVSDPTLKELAGKVDDLISELKSQQDKITELEETNKKLAKKVDIIEQQVKTNNLIFYNVTESKRESHKSTLQKVLFVLNRVMKVRTNAADISVALRADFVGNITSSGQNRMIVVKFANFATRMKVLAARSKLVHSDVWVSPDYSEQVSETRRQLLPFLYEARGRGHNAFLLYDKLVVDGIKKTLTELQAEAEAEAETEPETEVKEEVTIPEEFPESDPLAEDPDDQVEEVYVDPEVQEKEYEDY